MTDQYNLTQSLSIFDGFDISNALKDKTKTIKESVSGFTNQTINPIKSTIQDLKSGIALVKDNDKKILNQLYSYRSEVIETINDYLGNLTGGKISLADFGSVISYKDSFKIDTDQLTKLAGRALGFNISSIDGIGEDLSREFLNELNSMTLGLSDGLFQMDGGKITIAGDWDMNIANGVFNFLSSGNLDFKTVNNFAAANAVLNTMIKQNASIGFVEGFASFKNMYLYKSDYYSALINVIPTLLSRGDINSLKEILRLLDENSLYRVKSTFDNFAELVLKNFNLPDDALPEEYDEYKNILLEIITKVHGDNWYRSYTFMGWVYNLGLVNSISESSKLVLQKESSLIPFLCVSSMFNSDTAINVFKRDFPDVVML